jgi:hypothetical protein
MIIATLDSAGKLTALPDDDSSNPTFPFFGGNKQLIGIVPGDTIAQYNFNISTQVQRLIDDKITDYGLFLIASSRVKWQTGSWEEEATVRMPGKCS